MTDSILFIYSKNGNLKAIGFSDESKKQHDELISDGWIHKTTIDSKTFLIDLLSTNKIPEILDKIKSLSKNKND